MRLYLYFSFAAEYKLDAKYSLQNNGTKIEHRTYVTECLVEFLISLTRNIALASENPEHCSKEKIIL